MTPATDLARADVAAALAAMPMPKMLRDQIGAALDPIFCALEGMEKRIITLERKIDANGN